MTRTTSIFALSTALALGGCAAHDDGSSDRERDLDPQGLDRQGDREAVADAGHGVAQLTPCGDALCEGDEYCCNESCSICAPLDGGSCTMQLCDDDPDIGPQCGDRECAVDEICCDASCGLCAADEDACPELGCGALELLPCGDAYCAPGQFCCNESCGICAPIGGTCTRQLCDADPVLGEPCGDTICGLDDVCCDPLCGICAEAEELCPGPTAITTCEGRPYAVMPTLD